MKLGGFRRFYLIGFMIISLLLVLSFSLPVLGQGKSDFATNTPEGNVPFPSNTPDQSSEIATAVPNAIRATNTPADLFPEIVEPTATSDEPQPLATNTRPFSSEVVTLSPTPPPSGLTTNTPDFSGEVVTVVPQSEGAEPLVIATNTPSAPTALPQSFATATPFISGGVMLPEASFDNYALRLWLEGDMLEVLYNAILLVDENDPETSRAVSLMQFELERRFPGAPRDIAQRERLIKAALNAPRGTVDMRPLVRPYIQAALNNQPSATEIEINGFSVEVINADVDGVNPVDALITIQYLADDVVLYQDFVFATRDTDNLYTIVPAEADILAAPFGEIESIRLNRVGDVNRDGLDEMVIRVNDGSLNSQLLIQGYRSGVIVDLTLPNSPIRLAKIDNWATDTTDPEPVLSAVEYRIETESNWGCISEQVVTWEYSNNYYRSTGSSDFVPQDTMACRLHGEEPLFLLPTKEAITKIEENLAFYGVEDPAAPRAVMTLAMLYVLQGEVNRASQLAETVPIREPDAEWAANQSTVMLSALANPGNTAINICDQLLEANADGACDMDGVLERLFIDLEFKTNVPILESLEVINLPIAETMIISELGKADRTAVRFDLAGSSWWAFAPVGENDTYTFERIESPTEEETELVSPELTAPQSVYDTLLIEGDIAAAINILDGMMQENPSRIPTTEVLFIEALGNDLLGNRQIARRAWFDVWIGDPDSVWGQLAARHLELRQ